MTLLCLLTGHTFLIKHTATRLRQGEAHPNPGRGLDVSAPGKEACPNCNGWWGYISEWEGYHRDDCEIGKALSQHAQHVARRGT